MQDGARESLDARERDVGRLHPGKWKGRDSGFRLSVTIATSAALWLSKRATGGKSLVRTIILRCCGLSFCNQTLHSVLTRHRRVGTSPRFCLHRWSCNARWRTYAPELHHGFYKLVAGQMVYTIETHRAEDHQFVPNDF